MNKQRMLGYNLVELMLALVVLGLLLGSAVVPLQARFQAENRKEAEQAMADARRAVEGYAIIRRTTERRVIAHDEINYVLPAGRPYLPCPDITGDGAEDRHTIDIASPIRVTTMVIFRFSQPGGRARDGSCMAQKGLLPWRTLGLQEQVDPWGRKYGYWVDGAFSNEILGFDETFRADIFDPWGSAGQDQYILRQNLFDSGGLVCSRLIRGQLGCPNVEQFLLAGIITTVSINVGGVRPVRPYTNALDDTPPHGILDGAAFVVFSHGPNGRGGINRENRCLPIPADTSNISERANAYYFGGHPMLAPPFNCTPIAEGGLRTNLFVSAPRSNIYSDEGGEGADDIVTWASPNMLVGALLRGGALPVPKLEFLPEER